tara:strand:- start:79 stop:444 length:366 start_codon:yes stop_codon:yes gene_type:complete
MLKTLQHKKAIIEALEQSLGVVTTACKKVGISRRTFYDWMSKDEDFKTDVEDIQNIALDFVESQLFKNIKEGKTSEMIFYLKTKGKKRGYIERIEKDLTTNGKDINMILLGNGIDPNETTN